MPTDWFWEKIPGPISVLNVTRWKTGAILCKKGATLLFTDIDNLSVMPQNGSVVEQNGPATMRGVVFWKSLY